MAKSKSNTKIPRSKAKTAYGLLSEIRALILEEPLRYDQTTFISRPGGAGGAYCSTNEGFPQCGTVGCVAGWVATLTHPRPFAYHETEDIAIEALGISAESSFELFDGGALKRGGRPQTIEHAKAGAAHIAKFQKKYRAQLLAKAVQS